MAPCPPRCETNSRLVRSFSARIDLGDSHRPLTWAHSGKGSAVLAGVLEQSAPSRPVPIGTTKKKPPGGKPSGYEFRSHADGLGHPSEDQLSMLSCCPSGLWGTVRNRQLWLDLLSLEWTRRFRSVASRLGRYHLVHQYLRTRGLPPEHELSP